MRAVQTRTSVLGAVVVGAALFLDLAVLDVAPPIADGGTSSPVASAPPTTASIALVTSAPVPTTAPTVIASPVSAPTSVAITQPVAGGTAPAQPAAPGTAAPGAPAAAADATTRTAPSAATPTPASPVQPVTTVTTPAPTMPVTPAPTPAPTTPAPTVAPSTRPPTTTTTPAPAAVEYRTYGVDGVGSVVLADTGSSITLSSTDLGAGWIYRAESNGPRTVKLNFFNTQTEQEAEWKATIESGRIQIEN